MCFFFCFPLFLFAFQDHCVLIFLFQKVYIYININISIHMYRRDFSPTMILICMIAIWSFKKFVFQAQTLKMPLLKIHVWLLVVVFLKFNFRHVDIFALLKQWGFSYLGYHRLWRSSVLTVHWQSINQSTFICRALHPHPP